MRINDVLFLMLRGNDATQSATCCTMCKKGWVGIRHERFENSIAFWAGTPVFSAKTVKVTQETGVVPRRRRTANGTPFESPHTTRRETVDVFYPPSTGWKWLLCIYFLHVILGRKISRQTFVPDFVIYILIRYWRWLCDSVCLFVRYRNHFPVVQFQN